MAQAMKSRVRVFKTAWFAKAAKKANIGDSELCACIEEAALGQVDDLGGGVFKIRLNKNMHHAILLAKAGHWWVFEYLFAKNVRENIAKDELLQFQELVKAFAKLNDKQFQQLIDGNDFVEICHGDKVYVQD